MNIFFLEFQVKNGLSPRAITNTKVHTPQHFLISTSIRKGKGPKSWCRGGLSKGYLCAVLFIPPTWLLSELIEDGGWAPKKQLQPLLKQSLKRSSENSCRFRGIELNRRNSPRYRDFHALLPYIDLNCDFEKKNMRKHSSYYFPANRSAVDQLFPDAGLHTLI